LRAPLRGWLRQPGPGGHSRGVGSYQEDGRDQSGGRL